MADLRIDGDRLHTLLDELNRVSREFSNAERFSDDVAGMVGHDDLAGTVHDFAGKWNIRREKLQTEIDDVADAVDTILQTFSEADLELAGTMDEPQ